MCGVFVVLECRLILVSGCCMWSECLVCRDFFICDAWSFKCVCSMSISLYMYWMLVQVCSQLQCVVSCLWFCNVCCGCLPYLVEERTLSIGIVLNALLSCCQCVCCKFRIDVHPSWSNLTLVMQTCGLLVDYLILISKFRSCTSIISFVCYCLLNMDIPSEKFNWMFQGQHNTMLPIIIFGSVCMISAVVTFALPETKDRKLPETVADVENYQK